MTGSVNSREADDERARQVAVDGLILRGLVGSTVHGLSNPGTDDRDEMGVCVEPPEYVIGLRGFDHYVSRTQPEGVPSGPGDLDLTIYGLRRFCRLAVKGSPTVLPVSEPDRARLRAVRAMEVALDDVVASLDEVTARLERLAAESSLPARADEARVDRFLVDAYGRAWAERSRA